MTKKELFILEDKTRKDCSWYVCGLKYYDSPTCDWILSPTVTQKKEDAMQFCESKAKILAKILSNQVDEKGCISPQYKTVLI